MATVPTVSAVKRADDQTGPFRVVATRRERSVFGTYAAEDTRYARRVSLRKPLSGIAETPEITARLGDEARLRARCPGERVLPLFEDRTADRPSYYVFAAPTGPSLAEVSQALARVGGPDGTELLAVFVELAALLREVHEAGIVLGELDLASVFCTEERGLVLLDMDFATAADVTLPSRVAGADDPAHRAPEQGMGGDATPASDVFAAALCALELVLGAHPFAAGGGEITHAIRTRLPAPLPRTLGLPVEVERLLARCLAKDASARPDSGTALALELVPLAPGTSPRTTIRRMLERGGFLRSTKAAVPKTDAEVARDEGLAPIDRAKKLLVAALVAMIAIGGAGRLIEKQSQKSAPAATTAATARLFVLARPWAEVWVDGEPVETTPLARPIVLSAGKHVVIFKHPSAPDEKRFVDLAAGQSVTLDVDMAVKRPAPKASGEPSP